MRYRKKPVVIDADQWNPKDPQSINALEIPGSYVVEDCLFIKTLEGTMKAEPMDWVIRGVKGEYYPCKPDIFEATYEKA